jgi:hypothetical protein
MEDNNKEDKIKSLANNPEYFGSYLNMARHNIFLIINHLNEKFKFISEFDLLKDDEEISTKNHILNQIFDSEKFENDRMRVYNYIVKRNFLPCIKTFAHDENRKEQIVDFKKLHLFLQSSFCAIEEFRNNYSHYLSIDDEGNKLKRKTAINCPILKDILNYLFKTAPQYSLNRYNVTQEENDFQHLEFYQLFQENSNNLKEHGFYFLTNLFLERKYALQFLKKISGFKNENIPPFKATLKTFTAFSLSLPDEKLVNEDPKQALLMEMLNELNKCPKALYKHLSDTTKKEFETLENETSKRNVFLNSTNYDEEITDEQLDEVLQQITSLKRNDNRFNYFALRFIDEMNLLPNIRFQINLGKLQKDCYDKEINKKIVNRRIVSDVNAFGKLSDFEDEKKVLAQLANGNEKLFFEQFAPHYNIINNKIGIYIFDNETKIKYPNNNNQPHAFISTHELPKLVYFAMQNPQNTEKVITDFIENQKQFFDIDFLNNIKSKIEYEPENFTKRRVDEKKITTYTNKIKKVAFLDATKEKELLRKVRLSKEELLNYSSKDLKHKKDVKNKVSLEYYAQIKYPLYLQKRKELLQKELPKGILVNQLPTKTLDYLLNLEAINANKSFRFKMKNLKQETKDLLRNIKKELEKPKTEQKIKLGEIATFLARDIINMVIDKEVKQKITSIYFNTLQNKIAYFSTEKENIINLCKELSLFKETGKGHVFLTEDLIRKNTGILDFYQSYLDKKKNWFEDKVIFSKGKEGGYQIRNAVKVPYNINKLDENFDFKTWLNTKSKLFVDLPVNLFENSNLWKRLQGQLKDENIEIDKFSGLISKLVKQDAQPFYAYKRVYKNKEKEEKEFDIKGKTDKQLNHEISKYAAENEKEIRFILLQDRIQRLMCEKILKEDKNIGFENTEIELKTIYPKSKTTPLNKPVSFKQKIIRQGTEAYITIIAENDDVTIQKASEEFNNEKGFEWTVKDFGRFKRFVKDRRIPELSNYFEQKEAPFEFIEYQLQEYEKYRTKVFDKVFELEKWITDKPESFKRIKEIELEERKKLKEKSSLIFNEVQFNIYTGYLEKKGVYNGYKNEDSEKLKKFIETVRNKFSHNQFPFVENLITIKKEDLENFINNRKIKGEVEKMNISIAKKVFSEFDEEMNRILEILGKPKKTLS